MNNESNHLTDLTTFVSKNFEISDLDSLIPVGDFKTLGEFKAFLTDRLAFLLDNKYDNLINILYRIDIPEDKLSKLFAEQNRHYIPAALADLIIERSLQKVRFRQKYKNGEL
ncbi:MAG: hypothetical protein WBG58_16255 [Ignavibacteriaceae bacterium]|jgi:hypothetical protein